LHPPFENAAQLIPSGENGVFEIALISSSDFLVFAEERTKNRPSLDLQV